MVNDSKEPTNDSKSLVALELETAPALDEVSRTFLALAVSRLTWIDREC